VVGADGTWSMDIPGNRLDKGNNEVRFEYGNVMQPKNSDSQIKVSGGDEGGGGLLMTILLVLGALIAVAVLGGVFVFFFVEFEEIEDDLEEPEIEVDAYAWAKDRQEVADIGASAGAAAVPTIQNITVNIQDSVVQGGVAGSEQNSSEATPAVAGYPGWKWDAEQNKWVPENP
jgi:flagellar basal body-associated protein FliL